MCPWTRREFLKATVAASAAAGGARVLTGCAGAPEAPSGVELRTLHFDLSDGQANAVYELTVGASDLPLTPHDARSRAQARRANGFLALVPDSDLTHYVRDVPFPADAPQSFSVTRDHPDGDGRRIMALAGIHVPSAGIAAARGLVGPDFALQGPTWRRLAANDASLADTSDDDLVNPDKAALWAVYHHPELISLEKTTSAIVVKHILGSQALAGLAAVIADLGDPQPDPDGKYGGWIEARWAYDLDGKTRLFRQDEQGNPVHDDQGRVLYEWDWFMHDLVLAAAGRAIAEALRAVRNDPILVDDGSSSDVKPGRFAILDGTHAEVPRLAGANPEAYSWTTDHANEWRWGQRVRDVSVGADRVVTFTMDNDFYRHLGVFAAFEDVDGVVRTLADLGIDRGLLGGDRVEFVNLLGAPERICGIPVHGDHTEWGTYSVRIPDGAAAMHILSGGLAKPDGDDRSAYEGVVVPGLVMTSTFELGLPAIMLAVGLGGAIANDLKMILLKKFGMAAAITVGKVAIEMGLDRRGRDPVTAEACYPLANFAIRVSMGAAFWGLLAAAASAALGKKVIPFVGICLWLADLASTTTEIAETSSDIDRSVRCGRTRVSVTNRLAVTVHRDPRDFEWPVVTTKIRLVAACSDSKVFTYDYPFDASDHDRETWTRILEIPTGGKVRVTVVLMSATDWIAGQGFTEVANVVPAGLTEVPATITIEERLVPLDSTTVYSHRMKLEVDGTGHRRWVATTDAPLAELSCNDRPGALCEAGVLSLNDATGQLAYSFLSAGGGLGICGSPASVGIQGWQFQNVNLRVTAAGRDPEETLRQVSCASTQTAHLLHDLLGSADGPQYAIVPTDGVLTLRETRLPTGPGLFPDLSAAPCWGRFNARNLRGATFHPVTRCVMAIVDGKSKLEVLRLGKDPVAGADWSTAPLAELVSGPGDLKGNVGQPVAVAPTLNGKAFLVLEQENQRIQALDDQGQAAPYFTARAEGDRWWIPLRRETGYVQYRSLSVEPVGYVYVLSSVGAAARLTDFRLDVYDPRGNWMSRTVGLAAAQVLVDRWRTVYSLNQEALTPSGGRTEPSVSQWMPSTPKPAFMSSNGGRS